MFPGLHFANFYAVHEFRHLFHFISSSLFYFLWVESEAHGGHRSATSAGASRKSKVAQQRRLPLPPAGECSAIAEEVAVRSAGDIRRINFNIRSTDLFYAPTVCSLWQLHMTS